MRVAAALIFAAVLAGGATLEQAIRDNDLATLRTLAAEVRSTPKALHYAAAFGSPESLRILIRAGADVHALDAGGATALIYAATSYEKTADLLKAGARANVSTRLGRTPLHVAAKMHGGVRTVRLLLDAGADVDASCVRGETPLMEAASHGSTETVQLLLARGADAKHKSKGGGNAVWFATRHRDHERLRLLLKAGADPNATHTFAGRVREVALGLKDMTPLLTATAHGSEANIRLLLDAGARIDSRDGRGVTALDAARLSDSAGRPGVMKMLLAAGAKESGPEHHAKPPAPRSAPLSPRAAIDSVLPKLASSSQTFFQQSGCIGCHHQPLVAIAHQRIGSSDRSAAEAMKQSWLANKAVEPTLMQLITIGADVGGASYWLLGAKAAGVPADSMTMTAVRYILSRQETDGGWRLDGIARPPFSDGDIARASLALRALQTYSWPAAQRDIDRAVASGRRWLENVQTRHAYERAEVLLGLHAARSPKAKHVAEALLREQTAEGTWRQTEAHAPDAYATAFVLYALNETGSLPPKDPRYQSAANWLLRNQLEDGTWFARGRAAKFQPYFESGFPHGHDQWISAAATSYAVMALAPLRD